MSVIGSDRTVANDDNVGFKLGEVGFKPVKAFLGRTKVTSGVTKDGIATPTEITEFQFLLSSREIDCCFEIAIFLGTFDHGVSEENDRVVVFKRDS